MLDRPKLFISDLHLSPERPEQVKLFKRFLSDQARGAKALYILGDFFESWAGDDDLTLPFHAELAVSLKTLAEAGTPVFFMVGNRDFLAGPLLCEAAGFSLLSDPTVIDLDGTPTLLTHGDQFCTDDHVYQAFRVQVRNPITQREFLAKPLEERRALVRAIRERSEHAKAGKKPEIMDVNGDAVAEAFRQYRVTRIIHGHTHRPARHPATLDNRQRERWVLPDWYETGGYLACAAGGCRLEAFP
jgi:UDP-2,3-diacylglucosamine hydrolase